MKAYYSKPEVSNSNSSSSSTNPVKDTSKKLAAVEKSADDLKESADALVSNGSKSLFKQKDVTTTNEDGTTVTKYGYDTDAIYKGVKDFVDDYNALIKSAGSANSNKLVQQAANMASSTAIYSKLLAKCGITVNKDQTLSIDEKVFKTSDMGTAKTLFNGTGSFAYQTSAKASMMNYTAVREAEKANTYTSYGKYSKNYSSGDIFSSYF